MDNENYTADLAVEDFLGYLGIQFEIIKDNTNKTKNIVGKEIADGEMEITSVDQFPDDKKIAFIKNTGKRGLVYKYANGEKCVIFVYPISIPNDSEQKKRNQFYIDPDSGKDGRDRAYDLSNEKKLKYFCFGVNNQKEKIIQQNNCDVVKSVKDYVISVEEDNQAMSKPTTITIPAKLLKATKIPFERAITEQTKCHLAIIHKSVLQTYIKTYIKWYDSRLSKSICKEYNRIIFGAPGTGKSYMLNIQKDILLTTGNEFERVTFHPDYSYANFVGTYKPVSDGTGEITYEYVPGPFMRVLVKALKDPDQPYLLIIEEINRANVAAVFGDVFQLLDRNGDGESEYSVQASEDIKNYLAKELGGKPEDYSTLSIPSNMYIWATMNSADQGVFPMDTAFKRRWDFTYLGIDDNDEAIRGKFVKVGANKKQRIEWNSLRKAINEFLANEKINEDKQLGPYFISRSIVVPADGGTEIDSVKFCEVFKNKVLMYLFEDAAKQKRQLLFAGCGDNWSRFSKICEEFDNKGIEIFNKEKICDKVPNVPAADDNE